MLEDKKEKMLGDSIKALLQYLQKYISPFPALFFPGKRFYLIQAERGFAAGAVLFDLGGNGAFWKKGCNAPWAMDFQEKRNPPQADSI